MKMWRRGTFAIFLAALIVASWSVSCVAAQKDWAFTLSPMVGGYMFDGAENIEDSAHYMLGIGYNFTKAWGTEVVAGLAPTEVDEGSGDVDVVHFRIDGLYHFLPDNDLVPYLAAGIGVQDIDYDEGPNDSEALFNWGGGIKYWLTENTALRADVRHLLTGEPVNNLAYSAGLAWQFAEEPKAQPRDSDGDGVTDDLDKCPATPRGVEVDRRGCPIDSDGDGVPDYLDKCPGTPEGAPVDARGCPLDSDGDGVPDYLDKCPGTPKGEMVDKDGCTLKLTLHINFDFDKAVIKPEFEPDLERAAQFIMKYEDVPYILIAGHTDSVGDDEYNKELSLRRAENVIEYLVSNYSIDRKRLVARGYGESQPVADNSTPEGRYENRRVEVVCCVVIPPPY